MDMQQELKKMVFKTIEDHLSLKEFESWLYGQEDLSNQMSDDFILGLFTFNYSQKGAKYEFKSTFLEYFEMEEFMLWKVKINLQDLIDGKESRDRILSDFYWLGYDGYSFLLPIGYYMHQLEDAGHTVRNETEILKDLKNDANELLRAIEFQEIETPDFKISNFSKSEEQLQIDGNNQPQKWWWKFWR